MKFPPWSTSQLIVMIHSVTTRFSNRISLTSFLPIQGSRATWGVVQVNDTLEDFRMNTKRRRFTNTIYLLQDDLTAAMSIEAETRFLM